MQRIINESTPGTANPPGHATNDTREYLTGLSTSSTRIIPISFEIDTPPKRGEGLNDWMYMTAIKMAQAFVLKDDALKVLDTYAGPEQKHGEVQRQVDRAYGFISGQINGERKIAARRPKRNDEKIREMVVATPITVEDIKSVSPLQALGGHPLEILKVLHDAKESDLLCLGKTSKSRSQTKTFREWASFPLQQQIGLWEMCVPNLMRSPTGTTTEGVSGSPRTRDNACSMDKMRFAVAEIDIRPDDPLCSSLGVTPIEICSSFILSHLDQKKLRMVVMSGGKSLHAWMDVWGMDSVAIEALFHSIIPYGVDWRGRYPEHQFRLPNGFRQDKQARQQVIFFNPTQK
jgi:hypothetical protein